MAVKEKEPVTSSAGEKSSADDDDNRVVDVISTYKTMLELMKPKETVLKGYLHVLTVVV